MMRKLLILAGVLAVATSEEAPDIGYGLQILTKVVRQYLRAQPEDLTLSEGVHVVSTRSAGGADARAAADDGTILGAVDNYLQNHEVRIRLPELMPGEGFGRAFKSALAGFDGSENGKSRRDA